MNAGTIGEAAALFAVTNIDDIVVLSLFFAQCAGHRGSARQIVAGQYLGLTAILVAAVAAAYSATFLPKSVRCSPWRWRGRTRGTRRWR